MAFISNIVLSNLTGLNDLVSLALTLAGSLALIEAASFFDFSSKKIQRIAGIASNQIYYFIYNCKPIFYLNHTDFIYCSLPLKAGRLLQSIYNRVHVVFKHSNISAFNGACIS